MADDNSYQANQDVIAGPRDPQQPCRARPIGCPPESSALRFAKSRPCWGTGDLAEQRPQHERRDGGERHDARRRPAWLGAEHVLRPRTDQCADVRLMTENSASLGVLPRAGPTRNEPTSCGGVSTTFQAGQSLAVGAASIATRRSSGECRLIRPMTYFFSELMSSILITSRRRPSTDPR